MYEKHGQVDQAMKELEAAYLKSISTSKKMDIVFSLMRLQMQVKEDIDATKESVAKCHALLLEGGDWERKNKLKVYEGLYLLQIREFQAAATLLLDCLATFNSAELLSYNELVFLTVTSSLITLDR